MVQNLEATAFSVGDFYDALNYETTSKKLLKCQGGLKWNMLTPTRPAHKFRIRIRPKSKRMVPYSFFGIRIGTVAAGSGFQSMSAADTTAITHMYVNVNIRYNEWNQNFDFARV